MDSSGKILAVRVNDFTFNLTDEMLQRADLIPLSAKEFHLVADHQSRRIRILDADLNTRRISLEMNGQRFDTEIRDELAQILDKMGFGAMSSKQVRDIRAPMPGLVLDILVAEGQEVSEGDKMLILEAMKMENSLIIHSRAKIRKVLVKKGQAVEKNQVLIELD